MIHIDPVYTEYIPKTKFLSDDEDHKLCVKECMLERSQDKAKLRKAVSVIGTPKPHLKQIQQEKVSKNNEINRHLLTIWIRPMSIY